MALKSAEGASCSLRPKPVWKRIWKLRVPLKARNFVWRINWNIIPHRVNLACKGIFDFIRCIRYECEESLFYVLTDCQWAKDVWDAARIPFPTNNVSSFKDIIDFVWSFCGISKAEKFRSVETS